MKNCFTARYLVYSFYIILVTAILSGCSDSNSDEPKADEPKADVYEYLAIRSHCDPLIIPIKVNDVITINTTGEVITNISGSVSDCDIWTDADGIVDCHYVTEVTELQGLPFMALIGKFNGDYFVVGTSYSYTFTTAGNLELSVNDWGGCGDDSDNEGKFVISVLIE